MAKDLDLKQSMLPTMVGYIIMYTTWYTTGVCVRFIAQQVVTKRRHRTNLMKQLNRNLMIITLGINKDTDGR